jgi:hypothetical protein
MISPKELITGKMEASNSQKEKMQFSETMLWKL